MNSWIPAMTRAYQVAAQSPDPSTQNGAVIVNRFGQFVASGFNGPTSGITMTEDMWANKAAKYAYVEHAERAAIFDLLSYSELDEHIGSTMVAVWASCADCARAIVQSGIKTLIRHAHPSTSWDDSIAQGDHILAAGGVKVHTIRDGIPGAPPLRFNGGNVWDGSMEMVP